MIHLAYFNNIMYGSTEALWFFMKLILLASAPHRMKESTWSMEIKIISKYYLIWPQDRNLRNLLGLLYDDPKLLEQSRRGPTTHTWICNGPYLWIQSSMKFWSITCFGLSPCLPWPPCGDNIALPYVGIALRSWDPQFFLLLGRRWQVFGWLLAALDAQTRPHRKGMTCGFSLHRVGYSIFDMVVWD